MAAKGTIVLNIVGDNSSLTSTLNDSEGKVGAFGSVMQGVGQKVGQVAADIPGKIIGAVGDSINKASDFNESMSKINVVFGEATDSVVKWSEGSATSIGLSQQKALEAAGTYGNLFKSLGITGEASQKMSQDMVQLAGDLGSFNNVPVEDALLALRSGLTGETEPMKRFGVNMNDATLKAQAFKLGLVEANVDATKLSEAQEKVEKATRKYSEAVKDHGEGSQEALDAQRDMEQATDKLAGVLEGKMPTALTASQKAQAAYSLMMEQTTTAQGDFVRTGDGLANSQKAQTAEWENMQVVIGQKLLPAKLALTQAITALIPIVASAVNIIQSMVTWLNQHRDVALALAIGIGAVLVPAFIAWAISAGAAAVATIAAALPIIALAAAIAGLVLGIIWVVKHFDIFKDAAAAAFNWVKDAALSVFNWFQNNWPTLLAIITGPFGIAVLLIVRNWDTIKDAVSGVKDWIVDRWNEVVGFVTGLPGRIGSAAAGMFDGIKDAFRSAINWIIGRWNGISFGIPKLDLGPFGSIGGGTFRVPQIPYLAQGAYTTKPMLGVFGEAGPEFALPEQKLRDVLREERSSGPETRGWGVNVGTIILQQGTPEDVRKELDWLVRTSM